MRIVQTERIFISESERETITAFERLVEGLERESNNPLTLDLVADLLNSLSDLWEVIDDVE